MPYKLIALDIDGTIGGVGRPTSERARRAIRRARDAGAQVTLATGRTLRSAAPVSRELDITAPIATFQGALVSAPKTEEPLRHVPLTLGMMRTALDALADADARIAQGSIEIRGDLGDEIFALRDSRANREYSDRHGVPVRVIDPDRFAATPMTRLVARGDDDAIARLVPELRRALDGELHVTRSLPYFCEILHPDGGKHKALGWLCARLGISPADAIAFGNGYNDVQMLQWAGLSVAVDDAVPPALAAADLIAPPMNRDGVARVLEDLIDKGMIG